AAWTPSRRTGRWRAWAGSAGGLRGATARFSARRPLPGFVAQHPREELDGELTRPPALRRECVESRERVDPRVPAVRIGRPAGGVQLLGQREGAGLHQLAGGQREQGGTESGRAALAPGRGRP